MSLRLGILIFDDAEELDFVGPYEVFTMARQLKSEAREEFRSIVYGYMSRVRRGDAKLYFPDRVVQMHRIDPTPAEIQLIRAIAGMLNGIEQSQKFMDLIAIA